MYAPCTIFASFAPTFLITSKNHRAYRRSVWGTKCVPLLLHNVCWENFSLRKIRSQLCSKCDRRQAGLRVRCGLFLSDFDKSWDTPIISPKKKKNVRIFSCYTVDGWTQTKTLTCATLFAYAPRTGSLHPKHGELHNRQAHLITWHDVFHVQNTNGTQCSERQWLGSFQIGCKQYQPDTGVTAITCRNETELIHNYSFQQTVQL